MSCENIKKGDRLIIHIGNRPTKVIFDGVVYRDGQTKYKFNPEICPNFSFYFTKAEVDRKSYTAIS